jgi:hypothetical protein
VGQFALVQERIGPTRLQTIVDEPLDDPVRSPGVRKDLAASAPSGAFIGSGRG